MEKKRRVWGTIKPFLFAIGFILLGIAVIVAIEYLTSIQLIWVAIIIIVLLISKAENRISVIATKLGYIEDKKEDWFNSIEKYDFKDIHVDQIRSRYMCSDGLDVKDIFADSIRIADCIKIIRVGDTPYLVISDNIGREETVIGIRELRRLLISLKQKELNLEDITEEEFILNKIEEMEGWIKELEEIKGERVRDKDKPHWTDNDIEYIDRDICILNEWLEELAKAERERSYYF